MAHSFLRAGRLVDASKKHNKQVEVDWWRHKDKRITTTLREGHTEMPLVLIYHLNYHCNYLTVYYAQRNDTFRSD